MAAPSAPLARAIGPTACHPAKPKALAVAGLERPWASLATPPECCTQAARRSWVAQWRYAGWSTASEERVSAEERGR